jgi:hypothetical protein
MTTQIRLLIAVPGHGASGDIVAMPREEAAAWVGAGRAELVEVPRSIEPETATVRAPENTARRTRRPGGR